MQIAIADIIIEPRDRKDYGDIEELADSIARYGLIEPVVLDGEKRLIAGGRRLAAHVHLGRDMVEAVMVGDLDSIQRKELELEENLRRKDLSWPEEVRAVRNLVALRQERYGAKTAGRPGVVTSTFRGDGYGQADAAIELDKQRAQVQVDIQLANALDEMPYLEQEKSKTAAFKRFKRDKETQMRAEIARRRREAADLEQPQDAEVEAPSDEPSTSHPTTSVSGSTGEARQPISKSGWRGHGMLYLADSRDVLKYYQEGTVDCIVTDPPFGLGMFKGGQETSGGRLADNAGGMYDDDPHKIMDMLDEVFFHAAKVLSPSGHGYVFFHMTRYEEVFLMLRKHFGRDSIEETPLIWEKNTPGIGDPNNTWVYSYEPCFFINRGRHLVKPQAFNVLRYDTIPPGQKIHPTQKPSALLRHLITASCVANEVVLDPFAGSGSTLVAAVQVGCRFIGIEKHEPFYRSAVVNINDEIPDKPATTTSEQSSPEA